MTITDDRLLVIERPHAGTVVLEGFGGPRGRPGPPGPSSDVDGVIAQLEAEIDDRIAGDTVNADALAALAAVVGTKQPGSATLTLLAALATTALGRSLITITDQAAGRDALGLGTASLAALDTDVALTADSDLRAVSQKAIRAYIEARFSALVNGAPGLLDQLNELAAAIANDPNFATTMTTALAGKQPKHTNLDVISALTLTNDRILQVKAGGFVLSTPATVKTDLGLDQVTNDAQAKAADKTNDPTLATDSAVKFPTEHAAKGYTDTQVAAEADIRAAADSALGAADTAESSARVSGDAANASALSAEAVARAAADSVLAAAISALQTTVADLARVKRTTFGDGTVGPFVWNHAMGCRPTITVINTTTGEEAEPEIIYNDLDTATIGPFPVVTTTDQMDISALG